MSGARALLFAHCLVAIACIATVIFALGRSAEFGRQFDRRLEGLFANPLVLGMYVALVLSSLVFPACIAYRTVGRMPAWRWWPVVTADIILGLAQLLALLFMYPVRS
jgi:hypothetical protein